MSFLRHWRSIDTYEKADSQNNERAAFESRPLAHLFDESQLAIPWWVALQQSPPPLHQPARIVHTRSDVRNNEFTMVPKKA
jgi:hypothetical protein